MKTGLHGCETLEGETLYSSYNSLYVYLCIRNETDLIKIPKGKYYTFQELYLNVLEKLSTH